jgi:hypothetical protein
LSLKAPTKAQATESPESTLDEVSTTPQPSRNRNPVVDTECKSPVDTECKSPARPSKNRIPVVDTECKSPARIKRTKVQVDLENETLCS